MALSYKIFSGDNAGGPIDYSSPLATVTDLSWTGPALAVGSRTRFGVRAYDDALLLDDGNTDATVEIVLDGAGADATHAPQAPAAAAAVPVAGGGVRLSWTYPYVDKVTAPQGFRAYQGPDPGSIDYSTPVAALDYGAVALLNLPTGPRTTRFEATVAGLTSGTAYQWAVVAYNGSGEGPGTIVTATSKATPPANPANLTATATASGG